MSVNDGKANSIVTAVKEVLLKKGIPTEKLYGLGTDGAAVMTGNLVTILFIIMFYLKF